MERMRRIGLPSSVLEDCCSAIELHPPGGSPRARTSCLRYFTPPLCPGELENRRREPRSRTECVLVPGQVGYRLPRSRKWTTADSNRAPPACKAGALPDELAAHGRRGMATVARSAGMASCRI